MINQKKIFITVYPKKISLFTKAKEEFVFPGLKQEDKLIGNKRRRNKEDDIRPMIGRIFFNDIVLNLINSKLKNAGCISLEQIFSKKDLLFLKSKINAYLNIPLPNLENRDHNKIKEEEIKRMI